MADFLEKTLEDIIYQNRHFIVERGFPVPEDNMLRQVMLPSGTRMDLFAYDILDENSIRCTIYELKKGEINIDSLIQISAYHFEVRGLLQPHFQNILIEKILVGSCWSPEFYAVFNALSDTFVYIYEYLIDGIQFEQLCKRETMFKKEWYNAGYAPSEKSTDFLQLLLDNRKVDLTIWKA
jgi:hypothetical protein